MNFVPFIHRVNKKEEKLEQLPLFIERPIPLEKEQVSNDEDKPSVVIIDLF